MKPLAVLFLVAAATMAASSLATRITVDGAFVKPRTLDAAAIAGLPHVSVTLVEEHGR